MSRSSPSLSGRGLGTAVQSKGPPSLTDGFNSASQEEASSGHSPSDVPQVFSDSSPSEPLTSVTIGQAHETSGPPPPRSWASREAAPPALGEFDANSPQQWPRQTEKLSASPVAGGQENDPLAAQSNSAGTPEASESLKYTDGGSPDSGSMIISFNMSPILQPPSTDAAVSAAPSRRESTGLPKWNGEEQVSSDLGSQEASTPDFEADAEPVTPRGRPGSATDAIADSQGDAGKPRLSQVPSLVNWWEKKSGGAAGAGGAGVPRKLSTASSVVSAQAVSAEGRASRSSDDRLQRYWAEMSNEFKKQKAQGVAVQKRINEKLREAKKQVRGEAPASPESVSSASEPGSPGEDLGSPNTRYQCSVWKNLADHVKMSTKRDKAVYEMLDLLGVFSSPAGHRWSDPASESEVITPSSASAPSIGLADAVEAVKDEPSQEELDEEDVSELAPLRSAARLSCKSSASCKTESKVSEVDTTVGHSEMDSSRNSHATSMPDDAEPTREMTKESPRYSTPSWMRPDLKTFRDEPREEDVGLQDADISLPDSPCSKGPETGARCDEDQENSLDASVDTSVASIESDTSGLPADRPQAGQEGMPHTQTFLHLFEQSELHRSMTLIVPEGMDQTRMVVFNYEGEQMRVTIPEGYDIGQKVQISVPTGKRPPLEPSALTAWHRGHHNYPVRQTVVEPLRHCCRISQAEDGRLLEHQEYKQRYQMYIMLQGKSMSPLLPDTPEGDEAEDA